MIKQIAILTPGKVGSKTIEKSLISTLDTKEYFIQHLHEIDKTIGEQLTLKEKYQKFRDKTKWFFILGIRDPVLCHISGLFQNNKYHEAKKIIRYNYTKWWTEYIDNVYHKGLDIDLYQHTFDKQLGYSILNINDNVKVLIYKVDILNEIFSQAIEKLLSIPNIEIKSDNITSEKGSKIKKEYEDAIKNIKGTKFEIDQIYSTKFVKHFFTDAEIETMKRKWNLER